MKSFSFFLVIFTLSASAFADCRISLKTSGLSKSRIEEVKTLLKEKNYTVAKRLQGSETEMNISIFKVDNCVPGFDELYEVGGGFEILSPAHNIDIRKEGRFVRMFFSMRQFGMLKTELAKIPACAN